MATLKIRKSENEVIELPLTTEKPIARSLAVFQDGKVYYCPLVHSGDYLDSGVKVRINGTDYALATQIYDPLVHDSSGKTWINTKNNSTDSYAYIDHMLSDNEWLWDRGYISIPVDSIAYLKREQTIHITNETYFEFRCNIIRTLPTESWVDYGYYIFCLQYNLLNRLNFVVSIGTASLSLFDRNQPTSRHELNHPTQIELNTVYSVGFIYNGGKVKIMCNEEWTDELNLPISENDYYLSIGGGQYTYPASFYIGKISNVQIRSNVEGVSNLLFGD